MASNIKGSFSFITRNKLSISIGLVAIIICAFFFSTFKKDEKVVLKNPSSDVSIKSDFGLEILIDGVDKLKKEVDRKFDETKYPKSMLKSKSDIEKLNTPTGWSNYLKSILYYDPKEKGKQGFMDIIYEIKGNYKALKEAEKNKKRGHYWRKFYDMWAPVKMPSPFFGKDWKNWGETLKNTPAFIFCDDVEGRLGHLLYINDQFYVEDGKTRKKWDGKGNRFNSPVELEHLIAIVALGHQKNIKIKAFGTSHSWSPIGTTDGIILDNKRINWEKGIEDIFINPEDPLTNHPSLISEGKLKPTVTCSPGLMTGILEQKLWENGYSLAASTIEDVFTIGGIVATSSHGVGRDTTVLSDLVVGMTFVIFNGTSPQIIKITPTSCPDFLLRNPSTGEIDLIPEDVWRIAQINLGAFGILWDITMIVEPKIDAYFVTETARYKDYFSDTPEARKKLAELTEQWDTVEFWHYPLTFAEKGKNIKFRDLLFANVTPSDYVYIWKTTSNRVPEGYTVVEEDFDAMYDVWVKQALGAKFSGKIMEWIYTNGLIPEVLMPRMTAFTTYGTQDRFGDEEKKIAWKIPQWFANHPYPAVSVVEPIGGVLDIEWAVPMTLFDGTGDGLRHGANVYGHLIEKVKEEYHKGRYPVTISVEMRYLKGSGSPISPEYVPGLSLPGSDNDKKYKDIQRRAYAVPEIVSHSFNPYWEEFYERMNKEITGNEEKFGPNIRLHLAKQFSSLKDSFTYLRNNYRNQTYSYYPFDEERRKDFKFKNVLDLWAKVRERFDPKRYFTNPWIDQFFYFENSEYNPPVGFEVLESGGVGTNFKERHASKNIKK
eukprot:TRINITY_DN748_c0_g1_i1.p1 TRINITY_DN748_c0_g1~~TRINITY_DN748_c0_g1_i1.p1  ORF type:complete len:826 (-),score=262.16 TRINITY_DN748_c0_g1_i1:116-2593(-)